MSTYDFRALSPYDFECLVRDLLQAELQIHLESFAPGRDGGIDLRYAKSKSLMQNLTVQCKHYVQTGCRGLLTNLRRESTKVTRLKPSRYIVATSVSLTPANKQEIESIFAPYVQNPSDILGQQDLNNLLGKHTEVEKAHFKLWLSSAAVLRKVLHSHVHTNTESHFNEIAKKIKLYVVNPSFDRAAALLQKHRFCLIAGMPGIGKSMLAEMLLVNHIDRGFSPVVVSGDIAEANAVFDVSEKQIFYYDDFLGQTGRGDKLGKNEDARLLAFIRRVVNSPNKRLVLTTREHILAQAQLQYERLSGVGVFVGTCIVSLQDYAELVRAKIFYNHIYFSDLSLATRVAVLKERVYMRVIKHANYSPRLIEKVVDFAQARALDGERFVGFMLDTLEKPAQLWRHAFDNQLSDVERSALLALVSLPAEVELGDLERATAELCRQRLGGVPPPLEFRRALQVMENTFITIVASSASTFVKYHNPSIRDFMHSVLEENPGELGLLLRSALFFDQCMRLWAHRKELPGVGRALVDQRELLADALKRTIDSESMEFLNAQSGGRTYRARSSRSPERRYVDVVGVLAELRDPSLNAWLAGKLEKLMESWAAGVGDRIGAARLVTRCDVTKQTVDVAKTLLLSDAEDPDDIEAITLLAAHGDLDEAELEQAHELFAKVAEERERYALEDCDDPEEVESTKGWIAEAAGELGVDYYVDDDQFQRRIDELERGRPDNDYDYDRRGSDFLGARSGENEIDAMFESLSEDTAEDGGSEA